MKLLIQCMAHTSTHQILAKSQFKTLATFRARGGSSRRPFNMQTDAGKFVDLLTPCLGHALPAIAPLAPKTTHPSRWSWPRRPQVQLSVENLGYLWGHSQDGWVRRLHPPLAKADSIISKNFWLKRIMDVEYLLQINSKLKKKNNPLFRSKLLKKLKSVLTSTRLKNYCNYMDYC